MKRYVVENVFEHRGLKCVVVMQALAHRCGYVGVPKEHFLYGKDYDDYLEIKMNELIRIESYFQCHGGITYAQGGKGSSYPIKSDLWWFGFDCLHAWDKRDYETAKKLFADDIEVLKNSIYGAVG